MDEYPEYTCTYQTVAQRLLADVYSVASVDDIHVYLAACDAAMAHGAGEILSC